MLVVAFEAEDGVDGGFEVFPLRVRRVRVHDAHYPRYWGEVLRYWRPPAAFDTLDFES
jgi:hypothetical protein